MHQMRHGYRVKLFAEPGRSLEREIREWGVPFIGELGLSAVLEPFSLWRQWRALRRHILAGRPDVVHTHLTHAHWLAVLVIQSLPARQRPVLVRTVHRLTESLSDPLNYWLFASATDGIVTVSTDQARELAEVYPVAAPRIRMVRGAVNSERFRPDLPGAANIRGELGVAPDTPVACLVSRMRACRGHDWLLDAVPYVLKHIPHAKFWFVGEGELRNQLLRRSGDPLLRNAVTLAGYRTDDLPDTYAAADVGLLLGLGSEGSARAALESMASARPVVALRRGSLRDTIVNGVTGRLVEPDDVHGLADALVQLLGQRDLARRMGLAAREAIVRFYSPDARAEATNAFYGELLALRRGGTTAVA